MAEKNESRGRFARCPDCRQLVAVRERAEWSTGSVRVLVPVVGMHANSGVACGGAGKGIAE